jgi:hypothetical protein
MEIDTSISLKYAINLNWMDNNTGKRELFSFSVSSMPDQFVLQYDI